MTSVLGNGVAILDLTPDDLAERLGQWGEPEYRAQQILRWIYKAGADSFTAMSDLPEGLRERLSETYVLGFGREVGRSVAPDGTIKLVQAWSDGARTESVMIPARGDATRRTVCVSTQVGCDVGCRFCASGIGGAKRNLTVGEIVGQALAFARLLSNRGERLSNVVFMGMGEPLANYRATVAAVRRLNAKWGLGISQRKITISTVGLPKQIERLAGEGLRSTLALSLHAPSDELRRELIPWAEAVSLEELLASCRAYFERTGREVTLEYCLLAGINDRRRDAVDLARIARDLRAHVNLMLYNPVESLPYRRPSRECAVDFLRALRGAGANAHIRESRGLEADAACGQLRRRLSPREPSRNL